MIKLLILALTIQFCVSVTDYCVDFKSVQTSIQNADTNYHSGGHVYQHINYNTRGKTSFVSWAQMLGGAAQPRFYYCRCPINQYDSVCSYNFNQVGYDENGRQYKFPYAIYVFRYSSSTGWILLTAYPAYTDRTSTADILEFARLGE